MQVVDIGWRRHDEIGLFMKGCGVAMGADVARVVSLVTAIGQAGYAFAPAVFGIVRAFGDSAGASTGPMFCLAAIIQLGAACAILIGRRGTSTVVSPASD